MGVRSNQTLLKETASKLESPLGEPRITEQPRRHGSSARCVRDPMTQGYWAGGACRSCNKIPGKSFRGPGPFLVVSRYIIWTHGHNPSSTSCDPWPPGQLGAGRLPYRRVCIYVAHGKHCRLGPRLVDMSLVAIYFREKSLVGPSQVSRHAAVRTEPGMDRS